MKVPGFFDDDIHGNDGAGNPDSSDRSRRQQQRRSMGADKREDDFNGLVKEENRGVRPRLSPWR